MIGPDLVAEVANCPPGKKYELFLKYRDLFDFPAESLEASDGEDGQRRDAVEFPYVEQFSGSNNIGIQAPNSMTTNLVVPNVEPHDFASHAPRGFVPVQFNHARSLGRNQNSVFNSNGSSSRETETAVLPSSDNADMRKSRRLASNKRKTRYEDSEWILPQGKASRNKQPLQKKKRRMSRISDLTEVSPRAEGNKCTHCGTTETTEWSEGPNGANTLCKLCGIQFRHGLFQGADMAHGAVAEMGREMSQSSASFEVQPGADKAKLGKRNQNKKMKKPKMKQTGMGNHTSKGKCTHCLVVKTSQWREGPLGRRTLCNACGLKFRLGRLYPEYRPSKSPTFVPSIHSSKHREVAEIRKRVATMQASSSENEPAHPQSVAVKEAPSSENEPTKPQSDAVKKTSSSENAQIQSQSDAAQEATTESPPALPNTNEVATVAGTGTSMSPPKDMEEAAPALTQREVPSPLVSEAAKQIKALMRVSASARAFFKMAYIVICLCEKVKMMKERLSNLPQRPANSATAGPSMPVDSAFEEATTECVVGLVAKRVISPPPVAGGAMAAAKDPASQCGGGSVVKVSGGGQQLKRILEKKKVKKEKKKLPKVSSEGGAKKTVPQGSSSLVPKKCLHCDSTVTPQWRNGPLGPKTLCNACGMCYKAGGLVPEYRPAKSPAFVPSLHSSSRKLVKQMRKKDTTHEGAMGVAASSVNPEAANIEMGPKTPPPPECTPTNSYSVNSESGDLCGFP